jgi:hypothetical protein
MTARRATRFAWRWMVRGVLVLSLAGCAMTCVLWARSRQGAEALFRRSQRPGLTTETMVHSSGGLVLVHRSWRRAEAARGWPVAPPVVRWEHRQLSLSPDLRIVMRSAYDSWGFAFDVRRPSYANHAGRSTRDWRHYRVMFPHWAAAAALGIPPLGLLRPLVAHARTRRRARRGLCRACGYDLRATPDQCPECGALAGRAMANVAAHVR